MCLKIDWNFFSELKVFFLQNLLCAHLSIKPFPGHTLNHLCLPIDNWWFFIVVISTSGVCHLMMIIVILFCDLMMIIFILICHLMMIVILICDYTDLPGCSPRLDYERIWSWIHFANITTLSPALSIYKYKLLL